MVEKQKYFSQREREPKKLASFKWQSNIHIGSHESVHEKIKSHPHMFPRNLHE